jgi:hypothetical protein
MKHCPWQQRTTPMRKPAPSVLFVVTLMPPALTDTFTDAGGDGNGGSGASLPWLEAPNTCAAGHMISAQLVMVMGAVDTPGVVSRTRRVQTPVNISRLEHLWHAFDAIEQRNGCPNHSHGVAPISI